MEQIKSCDWLRGTVWPGPDRDYRSAPLILNKPETKTEPEDEPNGEADPEPQEINTSVQQPQPQYMLSVPLSIAAKEAKHDLIVRRDLEVLGISRKHLESHVERGARSPIIGTYRILMHR